MLERASSGSELAPRRSTAGCRDARQGGATWLAPGSLLQMVCCTTLKPGHATAEFPRNISRVPLLGFPSADVTLRSEG